MMKISDTTPADKLHSALETGVKIVNDYLHTALETSPDMIFVLSSDGKLIDVNEIFLNS
ncbi:MAG: hypothetical protein ACE5EH_00270 [Gammaproteobacteria bacterium]